MSPGSLSRHKAGWRPGKEEDHQKKMKLKEREGDHQQGKNWNVRKKAREQEEGQEMTDMRTCSFRYNNNNNNNYIPVFI